MIEKISLKGKKTKLALGSNPVLVGDYIYYIECKEQNEGWKETIPTGYMSRIKTDGSKKERVHKFKNEPLQLYKAGKKVYVELRDDNGKTIFRDLKGKKFSKSKFTMKSYANSDYSFTKGNYKYCLKNNNGKVSLRRKNTKTGKITTLITMQKIYSVNLCGDKLMVRGFKVTNENGNSQYKGHIYCMSLNGKDKHLLKKWNLAE